MARLAAVKFALTSFLLTAALASPVMVQAKGPSEPAGGGAIATIAVAELPRQARETYELIRQGGPFAYSKDGTVFGNRERLLPAQKRGYYREYTVATPGSRNRGARRIVCGGQPRVPDACYYTEDHYASFRRIAGQPGGGATGKDAP
ncbi:MAG: ribonuclease [Burkholderiaceae bacterium]